MNTRQFILGCMIAELDKIILARKAKVQRKATEGRPTTAEKELRAKLPPVSKADHPTRAACAKAACVGERTL